MVGREVVLSSRDEASALGTHVEGAGEPDSGFHPSNDMTSAIRVNDLVVMGSRNTRAVDGVTFSIRPGEILGIAGVEGNGQTELIEALAGLRPIAGGLMRVNGHDVTSESLSARRDAGVSHIPEDRHRRGLILDYSIAENLVLGLQADYARRGILSSERIEQNAQQQIKTFDIRPPAKELPARTLSGGNQQKVVIAREMGRSFSILLASQPTRGVDVGAIEFIHSQLREARADGKAVLLVSAELKEILALADRVAVMYRGKLTKVMPIEQADEETLGEYMTGTRSETAA
jgi:simple sugar transport system ATP-binding protein